VGITTIIDPLRVSWLLQLLDVTGRYNRERPKGVEQRARRGVGGWSEEKSRMRTTTRRRGMHFQTKRGPPCCNGHTRS
jgi:hypothetical protein